jgi:hypothetical protein
MQRKTFPTAHVGFHLLFVLYSGEAVAASERICLLAVTTMCVLVMLLRAGSKGRSS